MSVLTGPDNTRSYTYMGTLFDGGPLQHTTKSRIDADAPSAKAFHWAWKRITRGEIPSELEVLHKGKCGRCGRALTDPTSLETGLGPICRTLG